MELNLLTNIKIESEEVSSTFELSMNFILLINGEIIVGILTFEPCREKTGLLGFRPGRTQAGLYSHRRLLEA